MPILVLTSAQSPNKEMNILYRPNRSSPPSLFQGAGRSTGQPEAKTSRAARCRKPFITLVHFEGCQFFLYSTRVTTHKATTAETVTLVHFEGWC